MKNDPVKDFLIKMVPVIREKGPIKRIVNFIKNAFKPKSKREEINIEELSKMARSRKKEKLNDLVESVKKRPGLNVDDCVKGMKSYTTVTPENSPVNQVNITYKSVFPLPYSRVINTTTRKKMQIITGDEAENIMLNASKPIKKPTIKVPTIKKPVGRYELAKNKVESEKPRPEEGNINY
jgi:hypothetical protein